MKSEIKLNNHTKKISKYNDLYEEFNNIFKSIIKSDIEKKIEKNNNETIGISAENAVCDYFKINFNSGMHRVNKGYSDKIKVELQKENINKKINITEHIGNMNGSQDFICIEGETISLKTNKRNEGKICPQNGYGQPTLKSWDNKWNKNWNGDTEKNPERFNFIKKNISTYLNCMLKQTFCCDYLLHITNCERNPNIHFLQKPNLDYFKEQKIIFVKEQYTVRYDEVKKKKCEFSTNIKMQINNKMVNIGEFQFHFKSRQVLKFRFYYKFLKLIC